MVSQWRRGAAAQEPRAHRRGERASDSGRKVAVGTCVRTVLYMFRIYSDCMLYCICIHSEHTSALQTRTNAHAAHINSLFSAGLLLRPPPPPHQSYVKCGRVSVCACVRRACGSRLPFAACSVVCNSTHNSTNYTIRIRLRRMRRSSLCGVCTFDRRSSHGFVDISTTTTPHSKEFNVSVVRRL